MAVAQKKAKIPEHKHCPVCGRSMPVDFDFCSRECREKHYARVRREGRIRLIFYILYFALIISLFLLFFRPG